MPEAKLIIETKTEDRVQKSEVRNQKPEVAIPASDIRHQTSLSSLKAIREKVSQQNKSAIATKQLTEEELYAAWGLFIEKLRGRKNHSAITNFKAAKLKVTDENSFCVVAESEIHKTFIENERAELILHLQDHFNNRVLTYQIQIIEKQNKEADNSPKQLNTKEQYLRIIEEYPLVKELKDRLRLELDY